MPSQFRQCSIVDPIAASLSGVLESIQATRVALDTARTILITQSAALEVGDLGSSIQDLNRLFSSYGSAFPASIGTTHPTDDEGAEAGIQSEKIAVVDGQTLIKNNSNNLIGLNAMRVVTDVTTILSFLTVSPGSPALFILNSAGTLLGRDVNINNLGVDPLTLTLRVFWNTRAEASARAQRFLSGLGLADNEVGGAMFNSSAGRVTPFTISNPAIFTTLGLGTSAIDTLLQRGISGVEDTLTSTAIGRAVSDFLRERRPGTILGDLLTARSGSTELVRVLDLDAVFQFLTVVIPAATAAITGTALESPIGALLNALSSSWTMLKGGLSVFQAMSPTMVKVQDVFTLGNNVVNTTGSNNLFQELTNQELGQDGPQSMVSGFLGSFEDLSNSISVADTGLLDTAVGGASSLISGACAVDTFLGDMQSVLDGLTSGLIPIEVQTAIDTYNTASAMVNNIINTEAFSLRNLRKLSINTGIDALQNFADQGLTGLPGSCSDPNFAGLRSAITDSIGSIG